MGNPKDKSPNTGGSLGTIYTGPKSQDPGVIKAKEEKAKRDSVAAAMKKPVKTENKMRSDWSSMKTPTQSSPSTAGDSTAWKARTFPSLSTGGLKAERNRLDKMKGAEPASIIKQKVGMFDREISRRDSSIKVKITPKKLK